MSKKSYPRATSQRNSKNQNGAEILTVIPSGDNREQERQKDWQAYCRIADAFATLEELSNYLPERLGNSIGDAFCDYLDEAKWMSHPRTMRMILPAILALRDERCGLKGEAHPRAVADTEIDLTRAVFTRPTK